MMENQIAMKMSSFLKSILTLSLFLFVRNALAAFLFLVNAPREKRERLSLHLELMLQGNSSKARS